MDSFVYAGMRFVWDDEECLYISENGEEALLEPPLMDYSNFPED